jgi:hypothetical protein
MIQGLIVAIQIVIDLIEALGTFMLGAGLLMIAAWMVNSAQTGEDPITIRIEHEHEVEVKRPKFSFKNPFKR